MKPRLNLHFGSMTVVAMAKPMRKQVTFYEPVKVSSTTLRAGTYDVVFDDETGNLTIFKGKRAVAKGRAVIEKLNKDSRALYSLWTVEGNPKHPKVLTNVTLRDGNRARMLNVGDTRIEGAQ